MWSKSSWNLANRYRYSHPLENRLFRASELQTAMFIKLSQGCFACQEIRSKAVQRVCGITAQQSGWMKTSLLSSRPPTQQNFEDGILYNKNWKFNKIVGVRKLLTPCSTDHKRNCSEAYGGTCSEDRQSRAKSGHWIGSWAIFSLQERALSKLMPPLLFHLVFPSLLRPLHSRISIVCHK